VSNKTTVTMLAERELQLRFIVSSFVVLSSSGSLSKAGMAINFRDTLKASDVLRTLNQKIQTLSAPRNPLAA